MEKDLNKLVEQLNIVKQEFIKDKDLLKVSIRKDVVAVELKNILATSDDLDTLKFKLNAYIQNLYNT